MIPMARDCRRAFRTTIAAALTAAGAFTSACTTTQLQTVAAALHCTDMQNIGVGRPREIRMVALYTQGAAAAAAIVGNNVENEITLAFNEMNNIFAQSRIPVVAVLAHMEQVTLAEPQADSDVLNQLINAQGTLAVAHTLRDRHFADIVALVTTSEGGLTRRMLAPTMSARDHAFLIAGRGPMGQQFTLAHEVGHVLGGVDGRPGSATNQPRYRYAYAQTCTTCFVNGLTGWHTIMGTPTLLPDDINITTRIEWFSNPDLQYFGTSIGSAVDPFADNRETLSNTASLVAGFRYTPAWFASLGAEAPWFEKRVDPSPMREIHIGDFNGDRQADAFRVDASTSMWYVSYSASQPWTQVFVDPRAVPVTELRFADFDGNGVTEVFFADLIGKQWLVWRGGTDWQVLNSTAAAGANIPVTQMAFGNLEGDAGVDVFWADVSMGEWKVSRNGSSDWNVIRTDPTLKFDTDKLRLADFDKDGVVDVFRSDVSAETWFLSKSGTSGWEVLNGPSAELAVEPTDLAIGDFDGDGIADIIKPTGITWDIARSGKGPLQVLKLSCARIDNMALGDFDGDGSIDVLRSGIRP